MRESGGLHDPRRRLVCRNTSTSRKRLQNDQTNSFSYHQRYCSTFHCHVSFSKKNSGLLESWLCFRLCGLLSMARKLEDQNAAAKKVPKAKQAQKKAALVSGFSRFSKERGLLLRRTLNRISIRSNHYLCIILLIQALVAFLVALVAYFKVS